MRNSTVMRGPLAKLLVAFAMAASLLLGLPAQAVAQLGGIGHAAADPAWQTQDHQHDTQRHEHVQGHDQHAAAADDTACDDHHLIPSGDGDCHCQPGSCTSLLGGDVGGFQMLTLHPGHDRPASDQMLNAAAFLPPLRPPRA